MEAGLTNYVWTIEELGALLPEMGMNSSIDQEPVMEALHKTA
jgi:hypothetical protein